MYRRWGRESYYVLIGISWNCSASGTIVNCCNRSFMAINSYWMIVKMYANALLPQSDCSVWDLTCIGTFSDREQGCCSVIGACGWWWRGRTLLFQPAAGSAVCLMCSPDVFQIWSLRGQIQDTPGTTPGTWGGIRRSECSWEAVVFRCCYMWQGDKC